jgi:hypothetical protein
MHQNRRNWSSKSIRLESRRREETADKIRMSFSPEMRKAALGSCFGRLDEKESR